MGFRVLLRATSGDFLSAATGAFEEQPVQLVAPRELDWLDRVAVAGYLHQSPPNIIINFGLDDAPVRAKGGADWLSPIVDFCRVGDIPLIHFSSHRVFGPRGGDQEVPESTQPRPRDTIGKRLADEERMCAAVSRHMIVRLGWMLDGNASNILRLLLDGLPAKRIRRVSDHDFGRPVGSDFAARATLAFVQQILCGAENWGAFHLHSADRCSEAEFCDSVVRILNGLKAGEAVSMPTVTTAGDSRRLLKGNAFLGGNRCTNNFGIQMPSWRQGLKARVQSCLRAKACLETSV